MLEIVGFIINIKEELRDNALKALKDMSHVSIYGARNNQIVLLTDTDEVGILAKKIKEIQAINGVVDVYPIFSRDSLPF